MKVVFSQEKGSRDAYLCGGPGDDCILLAQVYQQEVGYPEKWFVSPTTRMKALGMQGMGFRTLQDAKEHIQYELLRILG